MSRPSIATTKTLTSLRTCSSPDPTPKAREFCMTSIYDFVVYERILYVSGNS